MQSAVTLAAAVGVVGVCGALAGEPPAPPSALDPPRSAVVNGEAARRLLHLAATRRIDLAIIGDSNVRNAMISGHEDGMYRAWAARYGAYATRVDPCYALGSWAATISDTASFAAGPLRPDQAPDAAAQYAFPTPSFPIAYAYLPAGSELNTNYNAGLGLQPGSPMNTAHALRYHLDMYRWRTPTTGMLVLTARTAPTANIAADEFPTASPAPGLACVALDVPAGDRGGATVLFAPGDLAGERATKGPLFALWQRVEDLEQATGVAVSPLIYQGGRSARAACAELNAITPASPALREWLVQATRLQGASPVLCVQILHGGNDAGDEDPSLGPVGGLVSSSPEGHADNLRGIMNNLSAAWAGAGYDPANLYFILGPYHPRGDRLSTERGYEQQWVRIAGERPNVVAVRGTLMSTEDEFIAMGWMSSAADFAHLSVAGYRAWGRATVEVLQRAACPADVNHDRETTVQDVFDFLGAYFAMDPAADFNLSGGAPTLDDLFEFLAAWFAGC